MSVWKKLRELKPSLVISFYMLSINDMQYLVTLAQESHFGRAAARCNVSQPALSAAIAKLENELGFLLCERLSRGIRITAEGVALAKESEKVLAQLNCIHALVAADKDQLQSPVQLGCSKSLGAYLYPQLLLQFQHQQYSTKIYLDEKPDSELIQDLIDNRLDVVLVANNDPVKDAVVRELFTEPWQILLPVPHPLSINNALSFEDLAGTVLFVAESDYEQVAGYYGDMINLEKVSSNEVLRGLVATQMGLGFVPFIAANSQLYASNKWILRSIDGLPARKVSLIWRATYPRYKMMELLSQTIKACAEWHLNFVAPEQHQMLGLDYLQR
jgi:LysR family hydrogen peroxide-inducible transcriptional activator